jgi:hypothetical protein
VLIVCLLTAQRAAAQEAATNQREFEAALRAEAQGDYDQAIFILSALAAETDAPRVRLELARILFVSGNYRWSKAAFNRVYRQDIPYPVRRSVNVYLDEIDQRLGFVRPRLGITVDSNPSQLARSGVYELFGIPFVYESTAESAIGVDYGLDILRPVRRGARSQLQAVASLEGAAFSVEAANRVGGSVGLRYDDFRKRSRITLGWRGFHNDSFEASTPFVEYYRRWAPKPDREVSVQTSLELNRFPERPHLDGRSVRVAVNYARDARRDTTVQGGLGVSLSSTRDFLLPEQTTFGQVGVSRSVRRANANLISTASIANSTYGAVDPFFGTRRRDTTARLEAAVYSGHPFWGLFPGLVLSYDRRRSNIEFYGFDRSGMRLDLRRRF